MDIFGLAKTTKIGRTILKSILGDSASRGGVYAFKQGNKWYIGKSNNLYKRLRTHMGTVLDDGSRKLTEQALETLQIIVPNNNENLFKLEAELMSRFEKSGESLANKIKSPGCKL